MTKKAKIDVVDFTVADIGFLVGELAEQAIQADQIMAKMNKELDAVRERYEEKLQTLRGNINIRREALEQWAENHKDLFKNPRTMEFERGAIGFRTGQPKLKLLAKRTWDMVKNNLLRWGDGQYTRAEVTVAKDLLIADRETLGEDVLRSLGVQVVQDDIFFCDVKKDEAVETTDSGKAA